MRKVHRSACAIFPSRVSKGPKQKTQKQKPDPDHKQSNSKKKEKGRLYIVPAKGESKVKHRYAIARIFLHGSRRCVRRGCTSHLRLVKERDTNQAANRNQNNKTQTNKPNPPKRSKVRTSSWLRQPVEKSETK